MTIIDEIAADHVVVEYTRSPRGKCFTCAGRVVALLMQRGIPYRVIGLLIWTGLSDLSPANHFAIVASIEGQAIIIDPTAGQFLGWQPFYGSIDDWSEGLKRYLPHRFIKAREFLTIGEANINVGSHFFGDPTDFNGIVLQNTSWHDRIMSNKVAFAALQQKQIRANDIDSRRPWQVYLLTNCFRGNR